MLTISSDGIVEGGIIPQKYTCDGANINPPLYIYGIPSDTKSLMLTLDDPNSPIGSYIHWLLYNINPSVSEIKEGGSSAFWLVGVNSAGQLDYRGPCPPSGTHNYIFTLSALNKMLNLQDGANIKEVLSQVGGSNILEKATLTAVYSKDTSTITTGI